MEYINLDHAKAVAAMLIIFFIAFKAYPFIDKKIKGGKEISIEDYEDVEEMCKQFDLIKEFVRKELTTNNNVITNNSFWKIKKEYNRIRSAIKKDTILISINKN